MKDGLTQVKELKDKIHEQYIEIQEINKRVEDLKTINEEHQILNGMLRKENDRLNNIINELEKWLEEEKDRLAIETSNIYEDSLGKTRLVNEDIFNEVTKIKSKLQELKGEDKE